MFDDWKPIAAKIVARWFVNHVDRSSGEAITQLKLQKLVYYADAWFLANFDKQLVSEEFEAWAHGPAIRSLYSKYRSYTWEALPREKGPNPASDVATFLEAVYEEYGQFSAKALERMTHEEEPWQRARGDLSPEAASNKVIPRIEIRNFYAARIGKKEIKKIQN